MKGVRYFVVKGVRYFVRNFTATAVKEHRVVANVMARSIKSQHAGPACGI